MKEHSVKERPKKLPPGIEIKGYTFRVVDFAKYARWGRKRTQDTGGSEG